MTEDVSGQILRATLGAPPRERHPACRRLCGARDRWVLLAPRDSLAAARATPRDGHARMRIAGPCCPLPGRSYILNNTREVPFGAPEEPARFRTPTPPMIAATACAVGIAVAHRPTRPRGVPDDNFAARSEDRAPHRCVFAATTPGSSGAFRGTARAPGRRGSGIAGRKRRARRIDRADPDLPAMR